MRSKEPKPDCLFCALLAGREGLAVVAEDAEFCVILDHRPVFAGHCLVLPKAHIVTLQALPEDMRGALLGWGERLATAQEAALGAEGAFIAINNKVSQSVPHLHLHAVPRRKGDGLRGFFWPRVKYADAAEMQAMAERLRVALGS